MATSGRPVRLQRSVVASDPRLEVVAADVRVADADGRLDIARTAQRLGVSLRHAELGDYVDGVMVNNAIVLNRGFSSLRRQRFTFAHEVGHLLISRGTMPWVDRRTEEWWADTFAHELVLPKRWLQERQWGQLRPFTDAAERRAIAVHLAGLSGNAMTLLRVDDAVICARCGDRSLFADCRCQQIRNDPKAIDMLPALVEAPRLRRRLPDAAQDVPLQALLRRVTVRLVERRGASERHAQPV